MKKIFTVLTGLSLCTALSSQSITVVDNVTMNPVDDASIYAKTPQPNVRMWGTRTDENGQADITQIASEDSLYVRHPAYGTQGFLMSDVKDWKYTIKLSQREILLEEVVLSATKSQDMKSTTPYTMEVINGKDVTFGNPQNTGDMLLNTGQVFVQRSQLGGSSPVLRGFEASRVLMVIDGVRMNNAIYRAGHLADCITVDPNMLDHTEVIFGPSSTMYGSDALGGTMVFYSKKPQLATGNNSKNINTNAMYRFSSANQEGTSHIDLNFGLKSFASLTSFTYSNFGDLRMGANANPAYGNYDWCREYVERINGVDSIIANSDPLVQKFSGYRQMDVTQKFLIKTGANMTHTLNFQYSTSPDGVPRYDRLQQRTGSANLLKFAEWYYGPQNRLLASYNMNMKCDSSFCDEMNIIAAFQKIDQDRITRKRGNNTRNTQEEDVSVISLNADLMKQAGVHKINYGLEVTHNIVASTSTDLNISTNVETVGTTRYADGGSTMSTAAVYFAHSMPLGKKLWLQDGIRFTMTMLHSEWNDTTFYPFPFKENDQNSFAPSGNVGLVFTPCEAFSTHVLFSTGFRAPNVDDMSKVFGTTATTLIVPNPDLNPEMVLGGEWGMDVMLTPTARWSVVGFYSKMTNAIIVKEFQLDGQDSVMYDGNLAAVVAPQNVDNAFIGGFSTSLNADFGSHFSLRSTVTATYGRYNDTENDTLIPLDHIPPVFGQTGIVYHCKGFEAEVYTRYNGWKHLKDYSPSGEDNLSQATAYGTPAWATLNFRATYQVNKYAGLSFACENILDQNYRHFASGISAPGRNFVVAVRLHY
jgi:hemoglobin/transferrin/lactoferrin receptor protein